MIHLTFRWRIILLMVATLLIVGTSIYLLAEQQITRLSRDAQHNLYSEKLSAIHSSLQQEQRRLEKTGLPAAYRASFQSRTLEDLRSTYRMQTLRPRVLNADGKELLWTDQPPLNTAHLNRIERATEPLFELEDDTAWVIARRFTAWDWTILYVVPSSLREAQSRALTERIAAVILIVSLISCTIIAFVFSRATRPIQALTTASQAMAEGDLTHPLPPMRQDEIGILTMSFQRMRDAIRDQLESLENEVRERVAAEEEVRRNEENLRTTLNSIGDAVIATDRDGHVVRMNPVAETLTGWTLSEARGRELGEIFIIFNALTQETMDSPVEKVLASGEIVGLSNHTVLRSRDGTEYQISDSGAPIRSDQGEINGVVLVFRDVTKEYALEEQLRQSQKMEAIGQLAGGVAHDFNNMLGGILGATDLLKVKRDNPEKVDYFADIIESAVERATNLTQQLLTFARKHTPSFEPVSIHETVHDTIQLLMGSIDKRIEVTQHLNAEHDLVSGDMAQLQSILLNLGINASHAIAGVGTIDFATHTVHLDETHCKFSPFNLTPGHYLQIEVRDSGSGISPQDMERIFEPFFTTKEKGRGTGLGLAVAFGSVQQHNGAISVYSEMGVGTTFHIHLPLLEGEQRLLPTHREEIVEGSGHILMIDDEEVMRLTGRAMLEELGYQVTMATNGREGLETYRAAPQSFDLVLLDMIMPEMNGHDCFHALLKVNPKIRVVLASGFSQEEKVAEMQEKGLCDFVRKPFKRSTLSQAIHHSLHSPGRLQQNRTDLGDE